MTQVAIHNLCAPAKLSVLARIIRAMSVSRQRRHLARLDDRALEDIGLTRTQAKTEAQRPVWDSPEFWEYY
ncbi:MAG: DUF1127 domain-containing protein [Pseudomonadota bacterium]